MKKAAPDKLLEENQSLKKRIKELESLSPGEKRTNLPFSPDYIYRSLFRLSPYTIVVSRLEDGKIYDVSDNFCKRSGFSREEAIGKTGKQLKLWLDNDREQLFRNIAGEGGYRNKEVQHRLRDGTVITCLESVDVVAIGSENYIILITADITKMKQAQEFLITERDLNEAIINSLPGYFYILDEELRFLRWNDYLLKTTGYSAEELQRMTIMDFHSKAEQSRVFEDTKKSFHWGENKSEANVVMKDGTVRTFFFSSRRFPYQNKSCLVGTGLDITEKKQIQRELENYAENLEDANITLRVLMNRRNVEQKDFEEKLQTNINDLVIPYLQKLKKAHLKNHEKQYVHTLENNLKDVLSPFMRDLVSSHQNLTPAEIQIVDLIKKGKNTKEIAELLHASVNTISSHRNNIRKKLNLKNSRINLRSHILSGKL